MIALNDLKKIDFKKLVVIIKKNYDKDAALFTVVLFLIVFFGIRQFVLPAIATLNENFTKNSQKEQEVSLYKEHAKLNLAPKTEQNNQNLPVKIYQSPYPGMDIESASVELVEQIVKIIKETGNSKVNQIDFTTEDVKDDSGTASKQYGILRLNLSVFGTFKSIKDLFNEIYLMNYLVVIKKINIIPQVNSNSEYVNADLTLDLYIKKI